MSCLYPRKISHLYYESLDREHVSLCGSDPIRNDERTLLEYAIVLSSVGSIGEHLDRSNMVEGCTEGATVGNQSI